MGQRKESPCHCVIPQHSQSLQAAGILVPHSQEQHRTKKKTDRGNKESRYRTTFKYHNIR